MEFIIIFVGQFEGIDLHKIAYDPKLGNLLFIFYDEIIEIPKFTKEMIFERNEINKTKSNDQLGYNSNFLPACLSDVIVVSSFALIILIAWNETWS